jgi:hypothetical protein
VMNDAEFGREDHGLIPTTIIKKGLKSFDVRTDFRTKLNQR